MKKAWFVLLLALALALTACGDSGGDPPTDDGEDVVDPCADCGDLPCIDTPSGQACAAGCDPETGGVCDDGFSCRSIGGGVYVCSPTWGLLCDPCHTDADCSVAGLDDTTCVDHGLAGSFCGAPCQITADCPDGFSCEAVITLDRQVLSQCMPLAPDGEIGAWGDCSCSERAVSLGLSTRCGAKDAAEACTGQRSCSASGLSACDAPAVSAEICDGVDNDCDGLTDEATCDDSNECTLGSCDAGGTCSNVAVADGVGCDDASACSTIDECVAGVCTGLDLPDCADKSPCTIDSCDPITGECKHVDLPDDNLCDDGDPCTVQDRCMNGACGAGPPKVCDDGDPCTLGVCKTTVGTCTFEPLADGSPCEDGEACTSGSACAGGICSPGVPTDCDDGEVCTTEQCDPTTDACVYEQLQGNCDDGNECTEHDVCQSGVCTGDQVAGCFDGVPADVPACYEGVASTDQKLAALAEVNYVRELSGLPAVGYDHDSDLQTQQSALMTVANAELEHTPPESWQCWSQTGYDGSASSNLYISYAFGPDAETSPGGVVDAFLIDTGVPSLGHRRWVLDPFLSTVSYGSALGAPLVPSDWAYVHGASLKVINGADADISGLDLEDYVAYPVGSYPSDLIAKDWYHSFMALPSTASRYANANVDYGNVDVRVSAPGGTFMTVHSVSGDNLGYGLPNHLQFIVDGLQDGVTYTVEVSDVVVDGDARTYQYQFTLE